MRNRLNKHQNRKQQTHLRVIVALFFSYLLAACDGGISGTGDGGPPVVIQPTDSVDAVGNNTPDGAADSDDGNTASSDNNIEDTQTDASTDADTDAGTADADAADAGTGNTSTENEASADSATADTDTSLLSITDLSQLIPQALLQSHARNDGTSATQAFTGQLIAIQQEVATDLAILNQNQTMPTSEPDGFFDSTVTFSQGDTELVFAQASGIELSFFFSINSERAIHVLQDNATFTFRRVDRLNNSVFQATVISTSESTIIEADFNNNGDQLYLETYSDKSFTAAFTQHPSIAMIARQREIIDITGTVTTLENCTAATQDCNDDSNWSNSRADTSAQLSQALLLIESALSAINSPVNNLNADANTGVTEAVLAADAVTPQSEISTSELAVTEDQIQCGLQSVDGVVRAFCLQPQPFETDVVLLSETLAGGEIFYQVLQ